MNQKLLIVILNYIATDVTIDCLHSLARCEVVTSGMAKVAIWENGSGTEAANMLKNTIKTQQWQAWAELFVSPTNLGFTGGNNRVMQQAMQNSEVPDYFLLLNSDTLVTNLSLTSLIEFMDSTPQAGIAGSQLLTEMGEHQCSPFRFPGVASEFDQGLKLGVVSRLLSRWCVSMSPPKQATPVDWVSGASMILRTRMLQQTGLLDEDFFTYFEDIDLCQRAHQAEWSVYYVPKSEVIHLEGASSGIGHKILKRRPTFWFEARRRYYLKHEGVWRTLAIDAVHISAFCIWRMRRVIQQKKETDPPLMLRDLITNSVFFKGFNLPVARPSATSQR